MTKKICIIFSLFLSLFFSLGSVYASSTELNEMIVNAYIQEDGSAHIQEIWDMDINKGTEVYKVFNKMGASQISHLKVTDENGLQYQNIGEWDTNASRKQKNGKCGLVTKSNGYELCFGIGDYGKRKYTFEYDVSHFVKAYGDKEQGFNYAFFSDMSLKPNKATVTISSPYQFNENNAAIWAFGYEGDVVFEDGKVVMKTKGSYMKGSKMQLLMRIDDGTFSNAYQTSQYFRDILNDAKRGSNYDTGDSYNDEDYSYVSSYEEKSSMGIVGIFSAVIGSIAIIFAFGLIGKKTKHEPSVFSDHIPFNKKNVNMFRDIPCQKDIFEFYFLAKKAGLINEKDRGGMIAAVILRWVQNGYIKFDKTEESHLLFFKKDGFSIDLDKEILCHNYLETTLLKYFREAAGSNHCLETKEFDRWCRDHYSSIDAWFDSIDASVKAEYQRRGLISLEVTNNRFMGINIKKDRDVYDASVREEMEHVTGLKLFLQEMSLIDEKEVIEVKMWEEYLIFASILGIADKVQKQLGEMCPTFDQQSNLDTIYTMHMVHMFAYNSMQASRAAASAAQAARSGGHGGGASFGGGGGGFSGGGGGGVR